MEGKGKQIIEETNKFITEKLSLLQPYKQLEIAIDVSNFSVPDFSLPEKKRLSEFDIMIHPYKELLKNKPCIYVFEIKKGNTKDIIETYKKLNKTNKSAVKKKINYKTTYLYVGRSKSTILNRLKVHFGYKNTTENALQLLHWAKPLVLELRLNIYVFEKEIDFLLPLYESNFSKSHLPLIGHL